MGSLECSRRGKVVEIFKFRYDCVGCGGFGGVFTRRPPPRGGGLIGKHHLAYLRTYEFSENMSNRIRQLWNQLE